MFNSLWNHQRPGSSHKCLHTQRYTDPAGWAARLYENERRGMHIGMCFTQSYSCQIKKKKSIHWSPVWQHIHTAVAHPGEPEGVHLAEIKVLANKIVELWDFGGDSGDGFILVGGEVPVVHDGLIVVCSVLISDEVVIVFVEVMWKSCRKCSLI